MSAESIVSMNVGGTIFQTSPSTMVKYPDSKLARMYKEGQKIKNMNFFLDEDPEYFRIVLNFLRKGKVIQFEEETLYVGVCDLMKNLELDELVKLLEREFGFSQVVLEIGQKLSRQELLATKELREQEIHDRDYNPNHRANHQNYQEPDASSDSKYKEITITRSFLTRVPESHLAKFFSGKQGFLNPLTAWISKKNPNRYSINRPADVTEHLLKFMKMAAGKWTPIHNYDYNNQPDYVQHQRGWARGYFENFLEELEFYGIKEFDHYKKQDKRCEHSQNDFIAWNENYNVEGGDDFWQR